MTTNAYIRRVRTDGWPEFDRRLWQRGYYDHIVRDEAALKRIGEYIGSNPSNWPHDPLSL